MPKALENYHKQQRIIEENTCTLDILAQAFSMTGNMEVADKLFGIATEIRESVDSIGEVYAEETNNSLKHSTAQLGKIIGTMLENNND